MGTAEKPKPHSKLSKKQQQARKKQHAHDQAQHAGEAVARAQRQADQMAAQAAQDKQDKEQQNVDECITYQKFMLQTEDHTSVGMWCEKCDSRAVLVGTRKLHPIQCTTHRIAHSEKSCV